MSKTTIGEIEFYTGPMSETHDLRVVIRQEFNEYMENDGPDLEEREAPNVAVYAGEMLLWTGKPAEISGWLGVAVEGKIKAGKWEFPAQPVEVSF